jgi:sideroflexin-5
MASLRMVIPAISGLVAGTGVVAATANCVSSTAEVPPFSLDAERFDQRTLKGRWKHLMVGLDPSTLFASDAKAIAARELLQRYSKGEAKDVDDKALWTARALRDSCYGSEPHSDVAELVPRPFRMAGYVPFNGPIIVAMTVAQSNPAIIFWHVMNQTQNALVNYCNRNLSAPFSMHDLGRSYATAVGASVFVAFGLSFFIKRKFPPQKAAKLLRFVAFPSCVVASSGNCFIMRQPEIEGGWEVMDEHGEVLADGQRSSIAAKEGVYSTVMSRAILQVPAVLAPAVFTAIPAISSLIAANPVLNLPITTFICLTCFGVGLPFSLALFPSLVEVGTEKLEEPFRNLKDKDGNIRKTVFYNKGL